MKRLVFSILSAAILISCGEAEDTDETVESIDTTNQVEKPVELVNSFVLEEGKAGIFEIGKEVPKRLPEELSMRQFIKEEVDLEGKTVEHMHNVIFNQMEDILELIMNKSGEHHEDKRIEEIMVLSEYYETADQVSVGSTVEEFQVVYNDATAWYSKSLNAYVLETETILGTQFLLDLSACKKKPSGTTDMIKVDFNKFAEGSTIKKIRIY